MNPDNVDIQVLYDLFDKLVEMLKTPFTIFGVTMDLYGYLLFLVFAGLAIGVIAGWFD